MIISKERLSKEKRALGYRLEIIEKVAWLIEVLNAIAEDSYLSNRLVLKGGTALNLFHFDLPRMSVDIVKNVRKGFNSLLPFNSEEEAFIRSIVSGEGVKPELFINDSHLIDLIKSHPALLWADKKENLNL